MNPMTGKPDIDDLFEIQYKLKESNEVDVRAFTVPGESEEMKWVSRGPYNVGGRTKGLMFDPNDESDETVFAGGVSGGLFKNSTFQRNEWVHITSGIPDNIPVSPLCLIQTI